MAARTQPLRVAKAQDTARALDEIAVLLALSGEGRFKARAYERGAAIVSALADGLEGVIAEGRLTEIEGIGRALASQIEELWQSGSSRLLERLRAQHPPGAAELARLPGLTPIDCDVEAVLDALAGAEGAIEVNGDPHRLDLAPVWVKHARARHIPFVISADAHSSAGLGALRFGVMMARRGGLRRSEVLNTLPAVEFARRVRPVQGARPPR